MMNFPNFACASVWWWWWWWWWCVCMCVSLRKKLKLYIKVLFLQCLRLCVCVCLERNGVIIWSVDVGNLKRGSFLIGYFPKGPFCWVQFSRGQYIFSISHIEM